MKLVNYFDQKQCDKGSLRHRYDRVYEPVFESYNKSFTLLEIGIFKGQSFEAIAEYAPSSYLVGIDTFQRVSPDEIGILKHVKWIKQSSLDQPTKEFMSLVPEDGFDIIIDDGLHTHPAQRLTFENFFPYLKPDGFYFIEDVWPFNIMSTNEKQHPWLIERQNDWNDSEYEKLLNVLTPYNVTFHDLRKGYYPDSYIIEVRK